MFNIANLKSLATRTFGKSTLVLQRHTPEILTAVGIAGVVVAGVMASRATLKLSPILEEKNTYIALARDAAEDPEAIEAGYTESDRNKDIAKVYIRTGLQVIKLYGPAVSLGILSIVSIVSAHGIMRRRNVALVAAYKAVESSFSEYRKRVAEEIGEEGELKIRNNVYTETIIDEDGKERKVELAHLGHSPYAKFFDPMSSQWQKNADYNLMFLKTQESIFNDRLHARGKVFLNDVYAALDIPPTQAGQQVGWESDGDGDCFITFGLSNVYDESTRMFVNGHERAVLLDFNVDGIILDKLPER